MSLAAAAHPTQSLHEIVLQRISSEDFNLPVFNVVALRLQESLSDPDFSLEDLERLVLEDPALAGQILKTANSAFYRGMGDILTVKQAILRLGSQQVASVAMLVSQKQSYHSKNPTISALMEKLWKHSFASAIGCQWLFKSYGGDACVAFLSGLLHDIGKLGILKVVEELQADQQLTNNLSDLALEQLVNSNLHTECGFSLAASWNLPAPFAEVIRDHHANEISKTQPLLAAVRLMNLVCDDMGLNLGKASETMPAASPEAQILGLTEIRVAELQIHIEDTLQSTNF